MNPTRSIALRLLSTLVVTAGLGLAATASACPDSKTAGACRCASPLDGTTTVTTATTATTATSAPAPNQLMIPDPGPDPELGTPAPCDVTTPVKAHESEFRPLESAIGWLLSASGPHGGQKLSAERMGTNGDPKAAKDAVAKHGAVSVHARSWTNWRWSGYGGNIARPHRMPNPQIL